MMRFFSPWEKVMRIISLERSIIELLVFHVGSSACNAAPRINTRPRFLLVAPYWTGGRMDVALVEGKVVRTAPRGCPGVGDRQSWARGRGSAPPHTHAAAPVADGLPRLPCPPPGSSLHGPPVHSCSTPPDCCHPLATPPGGGAGTKPRAPSKEKA